MVDMIFYEKPGCVNNTRQKALLRAAGHRVDARNLLTTAWTPDALRPFFGTRPVAEWFNKAAPAVKGGAVDPASQSPDGALALMIADPLLIRRPLMEAAGDRRCGFDMDAINTWIGLADAPAEDVETCPQAG